MLPRELEDRAHGFVPHSDSIPLISQVMYDANIPEIDPVHDFRLHALIALKKEDDAIMRRRGDLGLIFIDPTINAISLAQARADCLTYYLAFKNYCENNRFDILETLTRNLTSRHEASMYIEYAQAMERVILQTV